MHHGETDELELEMVRRPHGPRVHHVALVPFMGAHHFHDVLRILDLSTAAPALHDEDSSERHEHDDGEDDGHDFLIPNEQTG